jgi:alpha-L-fucosidase
LQKHGKINAVIAAKISKEPSIVKDIERGGAREILKYPWQGTLTFGDWFYKQDRPIRHNARTVIETLADIISKNGNLLLNVELLPDGTIPKDHKLILDTVGAWINLNSQAIFASKPWKIYGDNLHSYKAGKNISVADLETIKKQESEDFNERTISSAAYPHDEVRFTTKGKNLYIFVLNPEAGVIEIPSLALRSPHNSKKISSIKMLGSSSKISFKQDNENLRLTIPDKRGNAYITIFEVKGLL